MTECSGVDVQVLPIAEQIDNEILARLRQIRVENGYQFDAAAVRWISRDSNSYDPQPRAIWVQQTEETINEDLSCPGSPRALAWDRIYQIDGYARSLDEDGHQIETTDRGISENQMQAAIIKAIAADNPSGWHSFGGLAINATLSATEPFDAPGYDGGRVGLLVTYRVDETNPFVKR